METHENAPGRGVLLSITLLLTDCFGVHCTTLLRIDCVGVWFDPFDVRVLRLQFNRSLIFFSGRVARSSKSSSPSEGLETQPRYMEMMVLLELHLYVAVVP